MTRDQLAHILRAASRITETRDVMVIGSQAILGSYDDAVLPDEAIGSIEVDLWFRDDVDDSKADLVDGAIGELSPFHETFGVYAQGVGEATAVLPEGWEERLVAFDNEATAPGRALCLEPHDLVASKLAAGRDKDRAFAGALLREGLVNADELARRIDLLPLSVPHRSRLRDWIASQT
jgi:hypothetical protein